jgi:hypothetical protein
MPGIPALVGSKEAAQALGIGPTNFSHLRKKMEIAGDESFPKPIVELGCGPIWRESDMLKFKKHYDSRRRRVRSSNGEVVATVEPAPVKKTAAKTTTKATTKKVAGTPKNAVAKRKTGQTSASVTPIKGKKLAVAGKAS